MFKKLLSGLKWNIGSLTISRIASLLSIPILARLLTPDDYGTQAAALLIISFFLLIFFGGIRNAIIQSREFGPEKLFAGSVLTALTCLVALAIILISHNLTVRFLETPAVGPALLALTIDIPLAGIIAICKSCLTRELKFRETALAEMYAAVFGGIAVTVALAFGGFGYWALVYGYLGSDLILAVLMLIGAKPRPRWSTRASDYQIFLRFMFGQMLEASGIYFARHGVRILIVKLLGIEQLGLYGRGQRALIVFNEPFAALVARLLYPIFSRLQDDPRKLKAAFYGAVSMWTLLLFPLSIFLFFAGPSIISIMLGDQWTDVIPIFQALCFMLYFQPGYKLSVSLVRSKGKPVRLGFLTWVFAVLAACGAYLMIPYGLVAVSVAVVLATCTYYLLCFAVAGRLAQLSVVDAVSCHARGLLLAAIVGIALWSLEGLSGLANTGIFYLMAVSITALIVSGALVIVLPRLFLGPTLIFLLIRMIEGRKHSLLQRVLMYLTARAGSQSDYLAD